MAYHFHSQYALASDGATRQAIRSQQHLVISAGWAAYSIVLVIVGIAWRIRPIRLMAITVFGLTILKVFLLDLREMDKIYRIIASMGLGTILLAVSLMYQKYRRQITDLVIK